RNISEYKLFNSLRISIGISIANNILIKSLLRLVKMKIILLSYKSSSKNYKTFMLKHKREDIHYCNN
ncbi:MAG: hypothetical protein ACKESC_01260, partial [Candidatus Hodgkinia cicadicola]